MKITNVEKFRKELYEAIEDTCKWSVEMPSTIFKNKFEYKDSMTEYNHSEIVDDKPCIISLARPMEINGGELYLTVDEDSVCFWRSENGYFEFDGYIEFEPCRNKLSFVAALVLRIANKIEQ